MAEAGGAEQRPAGEALGDVAAQTMTQTAEAGAVEGDGPAAGAAVVEGGVDLGVESEGGGPAGGEVGRAAVCGGR